MTISIDLNEDDAYDDGFQAYRESKRLADNPWPAGTDAAEDWKCGWTDAEAEHWSNLTE